jgi:hypothetical protein
MTAIASPAPADDNETLFAKAVAIRNAESPGEYLMCKAGSHFYHHTDAHWLYKHTCDSCGTEALESTVRDFLNAKTDAAATRALRPLERRSRRRQSLAEFKRQAAERVEAGRLAKAFEQKITFVLD